MFNSSHSHLFPLPSGLTTAPDKCSITDCSTVNFLYLCGWRHLPGIFFTSGGHRINTRILPLFTDGREMFLSREEKATKA